MKYQGGIQKKRDQTPLVLHKYFHSGFLSISGLIDHVEFFVKNWGVRKFLREREPKGGYQKGGLEPLRTVDLPELLKFPTFDTSTNNNF